MLAILTGKDVTDTKYGVSPARYDEDVLAKDKVRHVGDPIAAVAAVDERTAETGRRPHRGRVRRAARRCSIPMQAVAEGAPLVHDRFKRNINTHVEQVFGDVEAGFAESYLVREETFTGNHIYQCPMEPHASIAT